MFLGTPHDETGRNHWIEPLNELVVRGSRIKRIEEAVVSATQVLSDVRDEFAEMIAQRPEHGPKSLSIVCFYESEAPRGSKTKVSTPHVN